MSYRASPGKVRAFVGRVNDEPHRPYVEVEAPDWLTPAGARRLAERLNEAATLAESRFDEFQRTGKAKPEAL